MTIEKNEDVRDININMMPDSMARDHELLDLITKIDFLRSYKYTFNNMADVIKDFHGEDYKISGSTLGWYFRREIIISLKKCRSLNQALSPLVEYAEKNINNV